MVHNNFVTYYGKKLDLILTQHSPTPLFGNSDISNANKLLDFLRLSGSIDKETKQKFEQIYKILNNTSMSKLSAS